MEQTLRPYASAGVALAGASLIAITPMVGPAPDTQSRAVQLTSTGSLLDAGSDLVSPALMEAQPYPVTTPAELISDTTNNLEALQNQIAADPFPIIEQIIANQAQYGNDLATAGENAARDFTSAVQGFPGVLEHAFSTGNLYDELFDPYSYVLNSALDIDHDLLNGSSEVVQGVVNNLNNLVDDTGAALGYYFNGSSESAVPTWLSDLVVAPFYGPNAELAGFAGLSEDIVTAFQNGDYTLALSDLANTCSTVLGAFLNGYDVDTAAPAPGAADEIAEAVRRIAALNPENALLTGAPERAKELAVADLATGRGTVENLHEAAVRIAQDLAGNRLAEDVTGAQSAASTDLLSGAAGTEGLSTLASDLSNLLNPTTWLSDLTALFDPSAASDIGTSVSTDLSSVLLSLF